MRYDKRVLFYQKTLGTYDEASGNYGPPVIVEHVVYCQITEAGFEQNPSMTNVLLEDGSLYLRLRNPLTFASTYIVYDGMTYNVRKIRHGGKFYVVSPK